MTLHERLEAAIRERLAVAQAAGGQAWKTSMVSLYMNGNEDGAIRPVSGGPFVIQGRFVGGIATHVVANDPARIIRDCERDLKVLARHQPAYEGSRECGHCELGGSDDIGDANRPWPCPEITDLADAYAIAEEVTSHARQAGPEAAVQT